MKRGKASVVWELVDAEGAARLVVDVDAPLRPFGADPTPPHGTRMPADFDEPTEPDGAQPQDAGGRGPERRPTTDALLKALRAKAMRG